uniref:Pyridine nucleotide-disulfide n=1 Tax=Colletotrichum fructicola (strain Nara gc5) TaxID=1213859 RepID=L2FVR6_COLFN
MFSTRVTSAARHAYRAGMANAPVMRCFASKTAARASPEKPPAEKVSTPQKPAAAAKAAEKATTTSASTPEKTPAPAASSEQTASAPAEKTAASPNQEKAAPVVPPSRSHKVVVVGGGSAGLAISHQLLNTGKFSQDDIAVVDPATWHHYQPGWTLVGGGVKNKEDLKRPLESLVDPKLKLYQQSVSTFNPEENTIELGNGDKLGYEQLVVAPGIKIDYGSIKGLPEALANPNSLVSTIYGYETCDKVFRTIQRLEKGNAIFTQPAGVIKCAGAPQKVMWLALDFWKRAGLYDPSNTASPIKISFATGIPAMFGVPKYSAKLEELRKERGVEGLFQHDLFAVDGNTAVFARPDGNQITKPFDLLHVVPKMGPHAFVKNSPLADAAGLVEVDQTAAAVTSQAPVLVSNLLRAIEGKEPEPKYDGYTSCPLTTEYGKVLLAEFKYGGVPKETFGDLIGFDQAVPRRAFYYLKRDFFPWVYYNNMVKGTWAGPSGWLN